MKKQPFFFFLLFAILSIAAIVVLKVASGPAVSDHDSIVSDSRGLPIARPDTTPAPDVPEIDDKPQSAPADSISIDTRPVDDAGYEDGYLQGMDDGALGYKQGTGYDDSSTFPLCRQREQYAAAYREGYEKGYADGRSGCQFSIE